MDTYLEDFALYLVNERHAAQNTVVSYMRDVRAFINHLKLCSSTVKKATKPQVNSFFTMMEDKGRAKSTLQRSKAAVSIFYDFLMMRDIVKVNPVKTVKIQSKHRDPPEVMSVSQVERLLEVDTGNDFKSIRDNTILQLKHL